MEVLGLGMDWAAGVEDGNTVGDGGLNHISIASRQNITGAADYDIYSVPYVSLQEKEA